jgi:hypothetical protein
MRFFHLFVPNGGNRVRAAYNKANLIWIITPVATVGERRKSSPVGRNVWGVVRRAIERANFRVTMSKLLALLFPIHSPVLGQPVF